MRYFSDEQISSMKDQAKAEYSGRDSAEYIAYLTKIELLDKRNDSVGDCRDELMQLIAEMERRTEKYVHRGYADPDDEDNDAFEYENY